jgi:hypothetical protein
MNDENLEQHLRNLPAPPLPEAWRAEILSVAEREAKKASRPVWPAIFLYLRSLYARNPLTAGALTALWLLIFLFKTGTPVDPDSQKMLLVKVDPNRPIYIVSLSDQIRLVDMIEYPPDQRQIP